MTSSNVRRGTTVSTVRLRSVKPRARRRGIAIHYKSNRTYVVQLDAAPTPAVSRCLQKERKRRVQHQGDRIKGAAPPVGALDVVSVRALGERQGRDRLREAEEYEHGGPDEESIGAGEVGD